MAFQKLELASCHLFPLQDCDMPRNHFKKFISEKTIGFKFNDIGCNLYYVVYGILDKIRIN